MFAEFIDEEEDEFTYDSGEEETFDDDQGTSIPSIQIESNKLDRINKI